MGGLKIQSFNLNQKAPSKFSCLFSTRINVLLKIEKRRPITEKSYFSQSLTPQETPSSHFCDQRTDTGLTDLL